MVKGVNRQIIEINDTGNRHFERVLLFVAAGSSEMSNTQLTAKAQEYLNGISSEFGTTPSLRERCIKKAKKRRVILTIIAAAVITAVTLLVFNIL